MAERDEGAPIGAERRRTMFLQLVVWGLGVVFGGMTIGYFAPNLTLGSQSVKLGWFVAACGTSLGHAATAVWDTAVLHCGSARTVLELVDVAIALGAALALAGGIGLVWPRGGPDGRHGPARPSSKGA